MAENDRFDLSAASQEELAFKGTFSNRQRGNSMNGNLDRSVSFREGNEGQMLVSGATKSQRNSMSTGDSAPLAQCLLLDPINMGDQKYTRSGELRRVLGISFGNTHEDCAFGTAKRKSPPPVATEELKRFKASVQEASVRARYRSKRLDESLHKLNKCWEALNPKKQLKNDILPNERLVGSHFLKMGNQTHRSPSELVNQRIEDRPKNQNKRIRTSVAETRAGGQSNSFVRKPLSIGKDGDNTKDGGKGCDIIEEKIRKLPAGGETWDRKMKRKRSMGTVVARSFDGEGDLKRVTHLKAGSESGLQFSDAQGLRSGHSGNNSKLDVASLSTSSSACATANNEQEKLARDSHDGSNKERAVLKGNKFNVRDNNYTCGIYTLAKGKASREPQTGSLMAGNSSSVSRSCETLEACEQPSNVKMPRSGNGTINRKRPLPAGPPSSPMAQWVGQRPQKSSRTRRANVVSPVLNCDEAQMPLEGCSPSDSGTRMASPTPNRSLISKGAVNSIQQGRLKHENVSSPSILSRSEESGAGENGESRLNEKGLGSKEFDDRAIKNSYNINSAALATKKKKWCKKEEIGDGIRRQGRSNRGSSVLKPGMSPVEDKLEISTLTKPIRNVKPASEKNGSKSGRPPLKKSSNRKAISRLGRPSTSDSPCIAGESDDDYEDLFTAASFASNASYIGCSSSFWKKLESHFAPVNMEDIDYLKQLVKSAEEDHRCLSQMLDLGSDSLDGLANKDKLPPQSPLSSGRDRSILNQTDSIERSLKADCVDQHLDVSFFCRKIDSEGNKITPLYQRVLTALIIDDQSDEEIVGDGNMSFLCDRDSPGVAGFSQDVEYQSSFRSEYEFKSDMLTCNGNVNFTNVSSIHDQELDGFLQVHQRPLHPATERSPMLYDNGGSGLLAMQRISCSPSFHQFEQMSMEEKLLLELQSVGIYPEPVPDLADGDCEAINQDITQLQEELHRQVTKKRAYFHKLIQALEEGREMEQRALEQVAMDKLVELAYKKKLATRGSGAARNGIPKVSRPVALAFMKRTLARCRKFEETGRSCFREPLYKDVLFTAPPRNDCTGSVAPVNIPHTRNSPLDSALSGLSPCSEQDVLGNPNAPKHPSDQDFAKTGPILNRGKKRELLLDDVGGSASLRSASSLGNSFMGGAKGKRSERERDKDTSVRNSDTKVGRASSSGYSRGERKTKAKPKQNAAHLSTPGNRSLSNLMENTNSEHQLACGSNELISSGSNRKSKVGSVSDEHLSTKTDEPLDFTNLHELDSIELGVADELDGPPQDLDSWLNIDEDCLQDNDAIGLHIPMDDISELNMLL